MIVPDEWKTGNKGTDRLIAKALAKEKGIPFKLHPVQEQVFNQVVERKGKFTVAHKDDRTSRDNIVHDSKQEKERYQDLLLLQRSGQISGLEIQKRFVLINDLPYKGKMLKGVSYYADFYYIETKTSQAVIEEWKVKATKTKDFIIKMKLFLSLPQYRHIDFRVMMGDLE